MVPGSFGWGSVVFAAMTMFAPSRAARRAMALPMPRLAPVMNSVFPWRGLMGSFAGSEAAGHGQATQGGEHPDLGGLRFGFVGRVRDGEVEGQAAGHQGGSGQTVGDGGVHHHLVTGVVDALLVVG